MRALVENHGRETGIIAFIGNNIIIIMAIDPKY